MKTGDRIATVIFWVFAGGFVALLSVALIIGAFTTEYSWTLPIGMIGIALLVLGIRQCIRTIRDKGVPREDRPYGDTRAHSYPPEEEG